MRYVGIKNSLFKFRLVKLAPKLGKKVSLDLPCITADDCNRHFEVLKLFDADATKKDFFDTDYYHFNKRNNKSNKVVWSKIVQFRRLYDSIRVKGYGYKGY